MAIALERGDAKLLIDPEAGGGIARYLYRGRDVLRPAPAGARGALEMASFPLVPFANRIAHGRFRWNEREIRLPQNFGGHALHGDGWERPWTVEAHGPVRAVLAFEHGAAAWPWTYRARQTITLTEEALHIALAVTNRESEAMPVSLGFHPYFPKRRSTRLTARVEGVWLSDETQIPTTHTGGSHFLDLERGAELGTAPFVDHCHTGWRGAAHIDQPEDRLSVALSASPVARFLHVFVPEGEDYFCAEPVTAMPDAVHRPEPPKVTGLRVLAPGATFSVTMSIAPQET